MHQRQYCHDSKYADRQVGVEFFLFFFCLIWVLQPVKNYFTYFEPSQSLDEAKMGDPQETKTNLNIVTNQVQH